MSLRKSSKRRNGSKSVVLPKPNARRRCTPAPSSVGFALTSRLTGRMDMLVVLHYPESTVLVNPQPPESSACPTRSPPAHPAPHDSTVLLSSTFPGIPPTGTDDRRIAP